MTYFQIFLLIGVLSLFAMWKRSESEIEFKRATAIKEQSHRHELERKRSEIVYAGVPVLSLDDVLDPSTTFPMLETLPEHFRSQSKLTYHDKRTLADEAPMELPYIEIEPGFDVPEFPELISGGFFPGGDSFLHGFSDGQPVIKSVKEMGSMGILGGSGEGKSTYTRMLVSQAKIKGYEIYLADPEVGVGEESLADSLSGLGIDHVVSDNVDIEAISEMVSTQSRMPSVRGRPLLFIVDEVSDLLSQNMPKLLEAMLAVNRKGRKRNIYLWALGQDFSAAVLDPTVRNVFTTIASLPTTSGALGRMGSPKFREAIDELPRYHAAIWRSGREVDVCAVPNTTEEHINAYFRNSRSHNLKQPVPALFLPRSEDCSQVAGNSAEQPPEQARNNDGTGQEQQLIRDLYGLYGSKTAVYDRLFKGKLRKADAWKIINEALGE